MYLLILRVVRSTCDKADMLNDDCRQILDELDRETCWKHGGNSCKCSLLEVMVLHHDLDATASSLKLAGWLEAA